MVSIALFEDGYWRNFLPITLTKPTFDVKVGAKSFYEEYGQPPEYLLTREFLAATTLERHPLSKVNPSSFDEDTVFVNGLLHPGTVDLQWYSTLSYTFTITYGQRLLVAKLGRTGAEYLARCAEAGKSISLKKLDAEKSIEIGHHDFKGVLYIPWDIINALENSLAMQVSSSGDATGILPHGVRIIGNGRVAVGEGAEVEDGTVLDATKGGIFIGPRAHIGPSRIVGPTYLGGMTQLKQFTIVDTSYIGFNCRVSGEVEHSIISDYSNKAHSGFLGHSYVGEWVNLGAMTTTSDLKMTYGNIKMNAGYGRKVDTGSNKVGSFIGDMCKTSIGTLIYSGLRIGVSSHIHGLVAENVPSFTIYGSSIGSGVSELELTSALETQRRVMSRRGQDFSKPYEEMMRHVFTVTAEERKRNKVRKRKFAI